MKKIFLLFAVCFTCTTSVLSYDILHNNIYYNILPNNKVEVTSGYVKYKGKITIPETITYNNIDYVVSSIGGAFASCSELTEITLPNSITTIGGSAFENCTNLSSIVLPNSITKIEGFAFANCSNLTSITIPDGVIEINDNTFADCSKLHSFTFSKNIDYIGTNVFGNCAALSTLEVAEGNPKYHSADNCIIETATNTLILGCQTSIIPNYVTKIDNNAFALCSGLTSIIIPNNVTEIGWNAFENCGLTDISIPHSVTTIEGMAFAHCVNLSSADVKCKYISQSMFAECSKLTNLTIGDNVTYIGPMAFCNCNLTGSLFIPCSVKYIDFDAFASCRELTEITIGHGVEKIYGGAFYGCTGLTSLTIPSTVTEIMAGSNRNIIEECVNIEQLNVIEDNEYYHSSGNCIIETSTNTLVVGCKTSIIPNTVTILGESAFSSCYDLTSITIPNSVKQIGDITFLNCFNLANVIINSMNPPIGTGNIPNNCNITVPCTAVQTYKENNYWKNYNIISGDIPFILSVKSNNNEYGTTIINQEATCENNGVAIFEATAAKDYRFVSWNDGNTDNPRTVEVTEDREYIATFAVKDITTDFIGVVENIPTVKKVLENGTIYILRNGAKYTIDGRKVSTM